MVIERWLPFTIYLLHCYPMVYLPELSSKQCCTCTVLYCTVPVLENLCKYLHFLFHWMGGFGSEWAPDDFCDNSRASFRGVFVFFRSFIYFVCTPRFESFNKKDQVSKNLCSTGLEKMWTVSPITSQEYVQYSV